MTGEPKYRGEIDGLRALAVIPVILYHAGFATFGGGFVGVDVFYVISGYLITRLIRAQMRLGTFSIVDFYERRVRRILPALYLVVLACSPFAWLWLFPREMSEFAKSVVAVCLFTSNLFFNREINYFSQNVDFLPLIHTWSLAVEEQFYVVFPLLLLLSRRWKAKYLFAAIAALSASSLALAEWTSLTDPQADFYLPQTRAWELGVGAMVAIVASDALNFGPRLRSTLSMAGLALIGCSVLLFERGMRLPNLLSLAPVGGAALVVAFAASDNACGKLLGFRPLVGLGLISYGAYLWHQPIFALARFRFNVASASATMLALSAASFVLAYASWKFVERPFRDKSRFSRTFVFAAAIAVAALLIAAARIVAINHGFPSRMPPIPGLDDIGAYRNDCLDMGDPRPANLAGQRACRLGLLEARPDFLLIGDSHAAALADGLNAAALARGRSGLIVAANACLPIIGVEGQFPRSRAACRRQHDALADIVDRLKIKLVLMHARWGAMGERLEFSDGEAATAPRSKPLRTLLLRTLSQFSSRGAKTVIITSAPRAPYSVPEILVRKARYGLIADERADFRRYLDENRAALQMFSDPEVQKLARILDIYPFFCRDADGEHCAVADGARPYYFDESHLSLFGSLSLSPLLQGAFE